MPPERTVLLRVPADEQGEPILSEGMHAVIDAATEAHIASWVMEELLDGVLAALRACPRVSEAAPAERRPVFQRCPVCVGAGYVDFPEGVVAGQSFVDSRAGNYLCRRCNGSGTITTPFSPSGSVSEAAPDVEAVREGENDCSGGCGRLAACESEFQGPMCWQCYAEMCERAAENTERDAKERTARIIAACERQRIPMDDDVSTAYNNAAGDCLRHITHEAERDLTLLRAVRSPAAPPEGR
jgi:hypothetical protein